MENGGEPRAGGPGAGGPGAGRPGYGSCSTKELVRALEQLHGAGNAIHHEMLRIAAEPERREHHHEDG